MEVGGIVAAIVGVGFAVSVINVVRALRQYLQSREAPTRLWTQKLALSYWMAAAAVLRAVRTVLHTVRTPLFGITAAVDSTLDSWQTRDSADS
jgi:hypothetical protein